MQFSESWIQKYLNQAEFVAKQYSKDPSTKIGCVVVSKDNSIITQSWNGFARGVEDSPERLNVRETKYKYVVHSEVNAVANAAREGIKLKDSTFFLYGMPPCTNCSNTMIQAGVKAVYAIMDDNEDTLSRWQDSLDITTQIFKEAGVFYEFRVRY